MKQLTILSLLILLTSCSSALLTANSTWRTTDEKISEIKKMDKKEINYMWSNYSKRCWTAIDCAVKHRDYRLTEALLKKEADPNNIKFNYLYPIQRVAKDKKLTKEQRYKFLKLLLTNKANPNICTSRHNSPLNYAIINNDYNAVDLLLKYGAPVKKDKRCRYNNRPSTPLKTAIISGDDNKIGYSIIRLLIFYNADALDIEDRTTPYFTAAGYAETFNRYKKAKVIDEYASKFTRRYKNYYKSKKELDDKRHAYIMAGIKARKEIEKKRKLARKRRAPRPTQVIDDSNSWAGSSGSANQFISAFTGAYKSSRSRPKKSYASYTKKSTVTKSNSRPRDTKCREAKYCNAKSEGKRTNLKRGHTHRFSSHKSNEHACGNTRLHMSGYQAVCSKFGARKMAPNDTKTSAHVPYPVGIDYQSCQCTSFGNCQTRMTVYCQY